MQKPTKVALHNIARKLILEGVKAVYNPVRMTLGPEGGNALMYRTYGRGPRITNDGKTIAEVIEPKNPFLQLVVQSYREACQRTDQEAGDGTTTTTVISGYMLINTLEELLEGSDSIVETNKQGVMSIRRELLAAKDEVVALVKKQAKKIESLEDLQKIATVSVEDADLGKTIANLVWETGTYGHIDVVEGFKGIIETEIIKGMRFPAKVGGKAFINNPARSEMLVQDAPVIVTNYALDNVKEAGALINKMLDEAKTNKLAIVAPSFSEEVLVGILSACIKRGQDGQYTPTGIELFPVHAPSLRTEQFQDVAAYMGATFIDKQEGKKLQTVSAADLGFVEKLVVKDIDAREDAIATGGQGEQTDAVQNRITELQDRLKEGFKVETHKKIIEKRIASLGAAVGVIRVGAQSTAESRYLKMKIEDAVYAAQSAMEEGYVRGGGLCLKEIAEQLPQNRLTGALMRPYKQIMENAGEEFEIGEDIIDSAKSTRLAVENAVSVVAHLITVKALIPEEADTTPGDGYKSIARALETSNELTAQRDGLELERKLEESLTFEKHNQDILDADNG